MANLVNNLGGVAGFGEQNLTRNDDSFTSAVSLTDVFGPQGLNFLGTSYTQISINNNGNITFGGAGLSTYTPFAMQSGGSAIIAPFFADVDTRLSTTGTIGPNNVTPTPGGTSRGSDLVWYDKDSTGFGTLTVTWDDVGYYSVHTDKLNAFQLQLIGTGGGGFQIVFRYEAVNWVTGDASGGSGGFGGTVARAGLATGLGDVWYELPQSGNQIGMLAIEDTIGNTGLAGLYRYAVTSGTSGNDILTGTDEDDVIAAGAGNDTVNGLSGNDTMIGGAGADILNGGTGNNTYSIDALDTINEAVNAGNDTVQAGFTYVLGANLENLILTGLDAINGDGNDFDNLLYGNAGNNTINGRGGSDTISYVNSTSGVTVNLSLSTVQFIGGNQGSDILLAIENIMGSINGDTLTGNSGANIFNGNGGADRMTGGSGADTYYVDNTSDTVVETDNTPTGTQGFGLELDLGSTIDTVIASVNYSLSSFVENLTLAEGSANLNATGNSLSNILTGNAGANLLTGGTGNDLLRGGDGVDTAAFSGAIGSYTFGALASAGITVVNGPDGQDVLSGIEFATFGGGAPVAVSSLGPLNPIVSITRDGNAYYEVATPFPGPAIPGIQIDYQFLGAASGEVAAGTDANDFFNLLGGDDAANGGGGADILDGGIGSNFLSGGAGTDTFFLDGRGGTVTWSTITDWSAGEQLSVWGWNANSRVVVWRDDGAAGFTGITMHADLNNDGTIDTSVTWTGKTQASLPPLDLFPAQDLLWFH